MQKKIQKGVELPQIHGKLRILFDGQQLAKAFIQKQTGIFRVSDEVFRRLCRRNDVDIHLLMTNNKGEPEKYLQHIGYPEIPIVHMPLLLKTTKYRTIVHKTCYALLRRIMPHFYNDTLRQFDVYFSPYPPISPLVYDSGIKTACICHDVIPLQFPHFAGPYKTLSKNFPDYIKKLSADFVFFVSNSARRDFLTYRPDFPYEKTAVAYPGSDSLVDTTRNCAISDQRIKYGIPDGQYVFTLSESNPRKNFAHVIRSFVKYIEDYKDEKTNLVIGGKKLSKSDYIGMTGGLFEKHCSRIIITGYIADEDLDSIYRGAALFLFPSLYEGFGLTPLEAMKRNVPVITANNSSLSEVCGDAVMYVSGFSDAETSGAIRQILSDSALAAQMRESGLQRASMFSFDRMVEQIMARLHALKN
ncbi:MAG: glycosyltransferase family 4 protein [Holosporaceae bacterium]|jgi:glycosyltransferase involved in cell wall biosynthesis|nr:glycosyltransferase family 4 protein [Holosporaceae bacterium]